MKGGVVENAKQAAVGPRRLSFFQRLVFLSAGSITGGVAVTAAAAAGLTGAPGGAMVVVCTVGATIAGNIGDSMAKKGILPDFLTVHDEDAAKAAPLDGKEAREAMKPRRKGV